MSGTVTIPNEAGKKQVLEQYFSSPEIAGFMSSMMRYGGNTFRILDPGAGDGSLARACVKRICASPKPFASVSLTLCEIDEQMHPRLSNLIEELESLCAKADIAFDGSVVGGDFIEEHAGRGAPKFTHVIMNPPYKKINTASHTYRILKDVGLETTNLYTAFISVACKLLASEGQMVFITPRSFCNGLYFQKFRNHFLDEMNVKRIHLFDSRSEPFATDGVLQENVIIYAKKSIRQDGMVLISHSDSPTGRITKSTTPVGRVMPASPMRIIHIPTGHAASKLIGSLPCTLADLDLDVSTGKVVDFRTRENLRHEQDNSTVPLIRPFNISGGAVRFPVPHKHPNHIVANHATQRILIPNGTYVLVKRFTAKEERKRITASVWDGTGPWPVLGFENRVNYFHGGQNGIDGTLAAGLWAYLNSSVLDAYFREFGGNTQVNATDLRYVRYPSKRRLLKLGVAVRGVQTMNQKLIDEVCRQVLFL